MPTFTCWSEAAVISVQSRSTIAAAFTDLCHELTGHPRYSVQVVFTDLDFGSIFVAGQPAPETQVWIRIDIREGLTIDQGRAVLARIPVEVGDILAVPRENIWVYISTAPHGSFAEYGRVADYADSGQRWFEQLPEYLQIKLSRPS